MRDPAAKEAITAGWRTVYAWLNSSTPVRRVTEGCRVKRKPRGQAGGAEGVVEVEQEVVVGDELSDESDVEGDASPNKGAENGNAPAAQPPPWGCTVHTWLPGCQSLLAPSLGPVGQQAARTLFSFGNKESIIICNVDRVQNQKFQGR